MATGNFYFENRCVVVTNDDFESGNVPETYSDKMPSNYNRSFHGEIIEAFDYYEITLNCGYYEDACIDYCEKNEPNDVESMSWYHNYESKNELFTRIIDTGANVSKSTLYRICKNADVDSCFELIDDYLRAKEEVKVNAYIDNLKKEYGYQECCVLGSFSNGETIYKMVS